MALVHRCAVHTARCARLTTASLTTAALGSVAACCCVRLDVYTRWGALSTASLSTRRACTRLTTASLSTVA